MKDTTKKVLAELIGTFTLVLIGAVVGGESVPWRAVLLPSCSTINCFCRPN